MSDSLIVGLVQQSCSSNRADNVEKSLRKIRDAAAQGAQLVVLQELHAGPYFCQTAEVRHFDSAESIPGPLTDRLAASAREWGVVIIGSVFERRAPGLYHNSAVVLDTDGRIAGLYRKMHIPDDPGFGEKFYFAPGDLGFEPIDTAIGRLGVLVCWDQWFPEAARLMALKGASLLIYPTAIGWDPHDSPDEKNRQRDSWLVSQRAHAVANGLPVISVNRVCHEPDPSGNLAGIDFWGSSFVAGPQGEVLAIAPDSEECLLVTAIDRSRTEQVRRIWPFLRDRRIDAYEGLLHRYLDAKHSCGPD